MRKYVVRTRWYRYIAIVHRTWIYHRKYTTIRKKRDHLNYNLYIYLFLKWYTCIFNNLCMYILIFCENCPSRKYVLKQLIFFFIWNLKQKHVFLVTEMIERLRMYSPLCWLQIRGVLLHQLHPVRGVRGVPSAGLGECGGPGGEVERHGLVLLYLAHHPRRHYLSTHLVWHPGRFLV